MLWELRFIEKTNLSQTQDHPHLGCLDRTVTVHSDNVVGFVARYRQKVRQPPRRGKEFRKHLLGAKIGQQRRAGTISDARSFLLGEVTCEGRCGRAFGAVCGTSH